MKAPRSSRSASGRKRRSARSPGRNSSKAATSTGSAVATGGEESETSMPIPDVIPILPLRNIVVFPGTVVPLNIGRPASVRLINECLPQSKLVGVVAQRSESEDEPGADDLYPVGTVAQVVKLIRQDNDNVMLAVNGIERFRIRRFVQTDPYLRAEIEVLKPVPGPSEDKEWEATAKNLTDTVTRLIELAPELPEELRIIVMNIDDPGSLADFAASTLNLTTAEKQAVLEECDVVKRVKNIQQKVNAQLEIAHIQERLQKDISSQFSDMQRRAYLREQIRAIQRELGEGEEAVGQQVEDLRSRLTKAGVPEEVLKQADRELGRLNHVPPASAEFSVIVSYVEALAELPWNQLSEDNLDLKRAREILDRDHFDLEKVKRRLIEHLAVRKLNPSGRGAILCLLGPPGVGKTSLGQSIADALGRKFTRMSLGGMRDEAEIRGHRRTYIGSMPGRLMQELRRLGTRNPVFMLDEIDKLGSDFQGDPASALLEVLDPHQNQAFVDHYLDVPFDLSQIIFIATANYMDPVPPALRDRMEVLEIPGYTDHEKQEIATRYLVGRQLKETGLHPEQCRWQPGSLARIVDDYTREAGVRELEREIGSVCRAVAARVAEGETGPTEVTPELVQEILGPARYIRETRLATDRPGVATGLAYTPTGGEVLHIEAIRYPGRGQVTLSGQLGDVMRESMLAALSLVRSRADELKLKPVAFEKFDLHVHVPSGAIPKDGPSAGVAIFAALASLYTNRPVKSTVAMTGEITLRGLVLPIGGLKEKSLAALRAGIKRVLYPRLNEKDLAEIPEEVKQAIEFVGVETVDEVLSAALDPRPRPGTAASKAGRTRKHTRRSPRGKPTAHPVRSRAVDVADEDPDALDYVGWAD